MDRISLPLYPTRARLRHVPTIWRAAFGFGWRRAWAFNSPRWFVRTLWMYLTYR